MNGKAPQVEFQDAIDSLVAHYRKITADGTVTFAEVFQYLFEAATDLVALAEQLPADGAGKKQAVLEAVSKFIDDVLVPLDLPYVPSILEPVVDQSLKQLLLVVADGAVEAAVKLLFPDDSDVTLPPAGGSEE